MDDIKQENNAKDKQEVANTLKLLLETKNQAFSKLWKIYLAVTLGFNFFAFSFEVICFIVFSNKQNICSAFTDNVSWIVKYTNTSLVAFIICTTFFYALEKTKTKPLVDLLKERFEKMLP